MNNPQRFENDPDLEESIKSQAAAAVEQVAATNPPVFMTFPGEHPDETIPLNFLRSGDVINVLSPNGNILCRLCCKYCW